MASDPDGPNSHRVLDVEESSSDVLSVSSSDSASLNEIENGDTHDVQGIALLRQIFPGESTDALRQIHRDILGRTHGGEAVRESGGKSTEYVVEGVHIEEEGSSLSRHAILRLEQQVLANHQLFSPVPRVVGKIFSAVVERDPLIGLGMNLAQENHGSVYVHSFNFTESELGSNSGVNPASTAGIAIGDVIIGIEGQSLLSCRGGDKIALDCLMDVLATTPGAVVIHVFRSEVQSKAVLTPPPVPLPNTTQSILDTSDFLQDDAPSFELPFHSYESFESTPLPEDFENVNLHPFISAMVERKIQRAGKEQKTSKSLFRMTARTRQWEANGFLSKAAKGREDSETIINLAGVRKALSVRIVHAYHDENGCAYTVWTYDGESGKEWYAPVRYFRDFQDLRAATTPLNPAVALIPFPKNPFSVFASPLSKERKDGKKTKIRQLEYFLRTLVAMVYRDEMNPFMAEVAHHVQCFLGWDSFVGSLVDVGVEEVEGIQALEASEEMQVRLGLKRSIQRYVYRLFLLDGMVATVDHIVDTFRLREPKLGEIESLEAEGRVALKARAIQELSLAQDCLDQLQDMVLYGCMRDFRSIAERDSYALIHPKIHESSRGDGFWDKLVREAVREQIEIELYVPLRKIISKWLVNGWKHDDMEVQFKMRELGKCPDDIIAAPTSRSTRWDSVARILREGVGLSSLPCVKLQAIVDAASEINRIYKALKLEKDDQNTETHIGADEFLPIFIYCVVKAEVERPCALCILLRTLCDPINRIGETGYYFASFEAAITHLRDIDPAENGDKSQNSFVSVPLDSLTD